MTMRSLLLSPLSAALLFISTAAFGAIPAQVRTDKGTVEGEATTDGKVMAFKGIPYAAPPVGNLRWAPPAPAEPWSGVRSAHDFGYHCVQSVTYADMAFHDPGPSEDCLTLNVWTPSDTSPSKLPVMIWIYGGGLSGGSTSERRQDGQFLAHRNVVVVSMNYRLGIFGFFVHPELTAESPHHASGNYGLLDQNAAIQWVKANISAFGGDPANITIFGESAGSFSVSAHMASPLSRDLFQRAIGESGGGIAPKILKTLKNGTFTQAFIDKGRLSPLVESVPVRVILDDTCALLGAAAYAEARASENCGYSERAASIQSAQS